MSNNKNIFQWLDGNFDSFDHSHYSDDKFIDDMHETLCLFPVKYHKYTMTQANVVNEYVKLMHSYGYTDIETVTYTPNKNLKAGFKSRGPWGIRIWSDTTKSQLIKMVRMMMSLPDKDREIIRQAYGKCKFIMELG